MSPKPHVFSPLRSVLDVVDSPLAVYVAGDPLPERTWTNRAMADWLRWLGDPLSARLDSAAAGVDVPGTTVGRIALEGVPFRVVGWTPVSAQDLRPLAAHRWGLTGRQADVAELLAEGHANKSVATILDIAEATVELHTTRVLAKAGVENRSALVAAYWRLK